MWIWLNYANEYQQQQQHHPFKWRISEYERETLQFAFSVRLLLTMSRLITNEKSIFMCFSSRSTSMPCPSLFSRRRRLIIPRRRRRKATLFVCSIHLPPRFCNTYPSELFDCSSCISRDDMKRDIDSVKSTSCSIWQLIITGTLQVSTWQFPIRMLIRARQCSQVTPQTISLSC